MFAGQFFDFVDGLAGAMKFRQTDGYLKRFSAFGDRLREHLELKDAGEPIQGLEPLMLEAYRFMKYIRKQGNVLTSERPNPRPIDTAILEAMSILDEPLEYCVPLHYEADALECLSYSAWQVLKKNGELIYCKHCDEWLHEPCKKHKQSSAVVGMYWCQVCGGYLDYPCKVHGSVIVDDDPNSIVTYCKSCHNYQETTCVIHGPEAAL